ncbi:hypothetical protein CO038_02765 [Candidatus Pacearchaeota archaeon CG_4_9_14_0_2_um_filter_39_13]|nr:hypothetical protein [Candidatus Pacearchaeota archaeon]OIO43099.1 MAG: hypothetical protein AUJ64_02860 [Candidatus Pacearchaeota archaeon CG1_02_39_14]PJC44639.1 MAG: hypothetical protein CO038_02765 [Candidatus Pacearchaeota archaeon CG_4_9_14_0_2_um_filter_39_13]
MDDSEARRRYDEARLVVQEWTDKQGHERCWYYPELFKRLAGIFEITPTLDPSLPPRQEFEEGCRRYQDEEYAANQQP